ncbi:unnamed protein product [Phytophthora fragariaefolia]|uniref:Unnamed protein product n=1 Tax=Phytophthora fragariaefolia TaxID=1490495 RepID=A0A9W6YMV9_9STRA|nr:unnamed protein product [Phytophthora fragariaefolia]
MISLTNQFVRVEMEGGQEELVSAVVTTEDPRPPGQDTYREALSRHAVDGVQFVQVNASGELAVSAPAKRKGGRPKGFKNKPKNDDEAPKLKHTRAAKARNVPLVSFAPNTTTPHPSNVLLQSTSVSLPIPVSPSAYQRQIDGGPGLAAVMGEDNTTSTGARTLTTVATPPSQRCMSARPPLIPEFTIQRGHANYRSLHSEPSGLAWHHLCANDNGEAVQLDEDADALEGCMGTFEPTMELPTTLADFEAIKNLPFNPYHLICFSTRTAAPKHVYDEAFL